MEPPGLRSLRSPDTVPEAYLHSVAALMWPGATRAYQVTPEGDLTNGEWWVHVGGESAGDTTGTPRVIAYEDRWCPVVRWNRVSGPIRWEYEAVVSPDDEPGPLSRRGAIARSLAASSRDHDRQRLDAIVAAYPGDRMDSLLMRAPRPLVRDPIDRRNLFVSLRIEAINTGPTRRHVRSRITLGPLHRPVPFLAPDGGEPLPWSKCWSAAAEAGLAMAWGEGTVERRTLTAEFDLPPRSRRAHRVVLAAYPEPAARLRERARIPHATVVERTRAFWTREVERGTTFDLPDSAICEAVRAARVQLLSMRERRANLWVPIGGPFHYRDVWLRDGARAMQALALSGYTRESRSMAAAFLQFQWPHGPFASQRGQLDGTGQALWAFDQVLMRPAPAADTRRFALAAVRAWRALERYRALAPAGSTTLFAGLLPVTDPHDNELVAAQLVGNDAWAIAGYRATTRLARAAGLPAEADSVERSLNQYLATFARAARHTGRGDLPPSWQGRGIDWGNLAVGYPCMALPAADSHLDSLARRYWSEAGGAGLGIYGTPDAMHSYVGGDLGTWALLAGARTGADSVLDAAIAWRSASGGAAEIFRRSTRDFGVNFPPHGTTASLILTLVRNAVIFDDGDTLMLTLGARERWWHGSNVRRAPTRWGLLDLSFRRDANQAEWTWTPVPVWTALALPPGTVTAGRLPRGVRRGSRPDLVLAPPGTRSVTLPVTAAGGPPA